MTVPTNSLRLLTYGREVIKNNSSLAEKVGVLQKMVTTEKAAQKDVEEELMKFKSSITASYELAARFPESDKALEAAHAEEASLKRQVLRAVTEKADSEKIITKVCKEMEQRMMLLNVALVGRNLVEKLTRLLVIRSVDVLSMLSVSSNGMQL